jgi:hypothetical protein
MVKICRTAEEYKKLKSSDFDYGPKIYGNVDVSGKILAEILDLNERTVRRYAEEGVIHRSPDNPGLYRFESSVNRYVRHLERAVVARHDGTHHNDNDYGRNL